MNVSNWLSRLEEYTYSCGDESRHVKFSEGVDTMLKLQGAEWIDETARMMRVWFGI